MNRLTGNYKFEYLSTKNEEHLCEYDDFINKHQNGSFFQCSGWGEVKRNWQSEIVVIRSEDGKICGGALILIKKMSPIANIPLKTSMLYVPRGPVCDYSDEPVFHALLDGIKDAARRHRACLLRLDPMIDENDSKAISVLKNYGFLLDENPSDYSTVQTRNNYMLPLDGKTEEEVFENFHSKWRYNIRLAARKGVTCEVCGTEDLDDFHKLMQITGERDGFKVRTKEYYENIMNTMGDNCQLYICRYNGNPVSGALAVRYSGKTHYVYGASSNDYRNVMPNYLMQWEMIKWALQSKSQYYDFMGIPYYNDESHPNYGVYRFKKGFGGSVVSYAGEFDCLNSPVTGRFLRKYLTGIRS